MKTQTTRGWFLVSAVLIWAVCALPGVLVARADFTNGQAADGVIGQADLTKLTLNTCTATTMGDAAGIAMDTVHHRLYVTDCMSYRVLVYNLNTNNMIQDRTADFVLGQANLTTNDFHAASQSTLGQAAAVALDAANNRLFVADSTNNRILVFDVTTVTNGENAVNVLGQANFTDCLPNRGTAAPAANSLSAPAALAYDGTTQRLYVTDSRNHRVLVFDATSIADGEAAVSVLGQADFTSGYRNRGGDPAADSLALSDWSGLAVDTAGQQLLVSDGENNRVLVFDVATIVNGEAAVNVLGQSDFTSSGSGTAATAMSGPGGLCYDPSGKRLAVAEADNNRVVTFDLNTITDGEAATLVLGQADFTSGNTNRGGNPAANTLAQPEAVWYDSANSRMYVCDSMNFRVLIYNFSAGPTNGMNATDLVGQTTDTANRPGIATASSACTAQRGIVVDTTRDHLFVADTYNNRVLVFDLDASHHLANTVADHVLGQADFASNASDRASTVAANTLHYPMGLALDVTGGRLFVGDTGNNRVLVYDVTTVTTGENAVNVLGQANLTSALANRGGAPGQNTLSFPASLAYDAPRQYLFVGDGNNRVLVYDVTAIANGENAINVIGQADFTATDDTLDAAHFGRVAGIAYEPDHRALFACDERYNRVLVFDLTAIANGEAANGVLGQADFVSGDQNRGNWGMPTAGSLNYPGDVASDSLGHRLFVADSENGRVLIYDLNGELGGTFNNGQDAVRVLGKPNFTTPASGRDGDPPTAANLSYVPGIAFDGSGSRLYACDSFRIVVHNDDNTAPTISDIADQNTGIGVAVGPLAFTIADVETAPDTLTLGKSCTNTTLVPLANIVFGGSSGADRTVTVTPAAGQLGTALITITVSDGTLTAQDTFTLTVANRPPLIGSPAWADSNLVTLPAGTTLHVIASDPDGDPLGYAWSKVSGAGTATFATPNAADSGVTFSSASICVLRVTVTDGRGGSVTSDVTVTVIGTVDPRADVNGDKVVNALDLQIVIANFGKTVGSPGCDARADANADGVINALDLQIVIANFGKTVP